MASPLVAGMAAIAWREAPSMSAYVLRSLVVSSVTRFNSLTGKLTSGGRLNPSNLMSQAINENLQPLSSQTYQPSYTPTYVVESSSRSESMSRVPASSGCGSIIALNQMGSGPGSRITELSLQQGAWPLILLLLPVLAVLLLKANVILKTKSYEEMRAAVRIPMKSFVRIKLGNEVIIAETENVSAGGMGLIVNEKVQGLLAKGKKIVIEIVSPAGESLWEMDAKVAWQFGLGQSTRFGIAFVDQSKF